MPTWAWPFHRRMTRIARLTGIAPFLVVIPLSSCRGVDSRLHEQDVPPTSEPALVHAITGSVTYRARIALPPDATLNVRLIDVSLPEAEDRTVTRAAIATEGRQVPIPFELEFDPQSIQQSHHYRIIATIDVGDLTLFADSQEHAVLTHGAGRVADIELQAARTAPAPPPAATAPATLALEGTRWVVVEMHGQPIIDVPGKRAVAITFEPKDNAVTGSTGVNSFSGTWSREGERMVVHPGAMTMMAGPEPLMQQEAAFIRALRDVREWRITGETLELVREERVILKFDADK